MNKHGAAHELSPAFLETLESLCEEIRDSLPGRKTFALFVIDHDTPFPHAVTMVGSHTPGEVANQLASWIRRFPTELAKGVSDVERRELVEQLRALL